MANPTLLVSSFDNGLALTDTSGLGTWTGVGPIRYVPVGSSDGLWLEEGATNLVVNPTAVTDTTGWAPLVNRDMVRVTSLPGPLPGDWLSTNVTTGFQVTATTNLTGGNSVLYPTSAVTLTNAAYTYSGYIWVPSSWTSVGNVGLQHVEFTSATGDPFALVDLGIRDEWQFVEMTFTPAAGDLSGRYAVRVFANGWASGESLYVAGLQLELGSYSTSLSLNSLGDGYSGTTTHVRAASSASVDPTDRIDASAGAIAFRYKRLIDTGGEEVILTCGTVGSGTDYLEIGIDANDDLYMEWNSNNGGAQRVTSTAANIAVDTEYLFYFDWDGTTIRVSVDNGALDSDTRDAVEGDWGAGDLELVA